MTVLNVYAADDLVELLAEDPALLAIADAVASTQGNSGAQGVRLTRRRVALALAATLLLIASLLLGLLGLPGRGSVSSASAATSVRSLRAYRSPAPPVSDRLLPIGVRMFLANMSARLGEPIGRIQEPVAGTPSIFLVTLGNADLCLVVVIHGATASCHDELRQAEGSISADVDIVNGKLFVTGLASDEVTRIAASEGGEPPVEASLASNTFYAALPYRGGGTGALHITVERSDTSPVTIDLPGVPVPARPGSGGH